MRKLVVIALALAAMLLAYACDGEREGGGPITQPGELKSALQSIRDDQLAIMVLPKEALGIIGYAQAAIR